MQLDGKSLIKIGKLRQVPSREIRSSAVSIGMECLDRDMFDAERCYTPLGESGVKWARIQTGWAICEQQKGVYDFSWLDHIVDRLAENGVNTWFNVSFGNPVYMGKVPGNDTCVGWMPLYFGEETLQAFLNFVHALAVHFADRVRRYELWNEPDCDNFWYPEKPDPLEYARFILLTAPVIRQVIPDAEIGACSSTMVRYDYTPVFIRSGIASELDFYCFHAYGVVPEKDYDENYTLLRRLWDSNGGKHIKLYQGEAGYASWFPEKHWLGVWKRESQTNQAKYLLRRYLLDLGKGVGMSSFFQMADMTRHDYQISGCVRPKPAKHGLLDGETYQPKRSYYAMAHICAFFDDDTSAADLHVQCSFPELPKDSPVSHLPETAVRKETFLRKGYPVYACYLPEDVQMDIPGFQSADIWFLPDELPGVRITEPILIDLLTGIVYRPEHAERIHGSVSLLHGIPVTDYPLLITDLKAIEDRLVFCQ